MTTALFEPFSGIAGDMTIAAFLDLGMPLDALRDGLASLPLGGYRLRAARVMRGAIEATRFVVDIDETHPHRGLADIRRILTEGKLPDRVLARALAAFTRLAEAEGAVHGKPPEEIHFHEVGAVDAIVDITGAAILAAWAEPAPAAFAFTARESGYGAGTREDTALPNALRVTLGARDGAAGSDTVVEIAANLDDQTPEAAAHALERLMAVGALDAWITPVVMKKGRPGMVLTALAEPTTAEVVSRTILRETTTFGVRCAVRDRTILDREHVEVATPWGTVRVKVGSLDGERLTAAPEYEDCARIAREHDVPLKDVYTAAVRGL